MGRFERVVEEELVGWCFVSAVEVRPYWRAAKYSFS